MKTTEYFKYFKNKLLPKKNFFFFIALTLLFVLSFACLTLINLVRNYRNTAINHNYELRTLIVYTEDTSANVINQISHIANISFVGSTKYLRGTKANVTEFNTDTLKGKIKLLPVINGQDFPTNYDIKKLSDNKIICPQKFYPHELMITNNNAYVDKIIYSEIKDGRDVIGQNISIESKVDNQIYSFEIVDTYNQELAFQDLNTCLVSVAAYDKIASPYSGRGIGTDINGNKIEDYFPYENLMVVVNNYQNVNQVKEDLNKLGYETENYYVFDDTSITLFFNIPIIICLIIFLICLNILYNYLSKKTKEKMPIYGLLSSIGYENKLIKKLDIIENLLLTFSSFILAFSVYFVALKVVTRQFLSELVYQSVSIHLPILFILIYVLVINLFIIITNKKLLNKILKKDPSELLRG